MTAPAFPGGTSVSRLRVYDGVAPDGLAGGTPHLHTASSEAYLVVAGEGELHTVSADGLAVTPLTPGATVWFSPGVIHRAVNLGGLEVRVLMSNAGLPEAGDAVMTFHDAILADPDAYARAAALPGPEASDEDRLAAAMRRRDLAVEGFCALLDGDRVDADALARLHARAVALVAPRVERWRELWRDAAMREARETEVRLDALARADAAALADGRVAAASSTAALGMCGFLLQDHLGRTP